MSRAHCGTMEKWSVGSGGYDGGETHRRPARTKKDKNTLI